MDNIKNCGIWKTPAILDELIKCLTNKLTASSIATHISRFANIPISRNAIIGKVHRMGMKLESGYTNKYHPRRPKPNKSDNLLRPRIKTIVQLREPQMPLVQSRNLTLLELKPHDCRYPYGERAPFLFCGNQVVEGQSYCAAHADLCFTSARTDIQRFAGFRR